MFSFFFRYKLHIWAFYFLLAFPLFYFVYKHLNLGLGYKDYSHYVNLYSGWNFSKTEAPYNMRLVSSFLVYLMTKLNFFYPTETSFDTLNAGQDKVAFFCAVFLNYIFLVASSCMLYKLVIKQLKNKFNALFTGVLLILGTGTVFFLVSPLADCFSVFLFVIILYFYQQRNYWLIPFFILSVFQREYVFIVFGVVAGMDFLKERNKYFLHVGVMCVLCFITYAVLRKTIFHTPLYANQLSFSKSWEALLDSVHLWKSILTQQAMTMNLVFIYLGLILYKRNKGHNWNKFNLYKIVLVFVITNLIGFASMVGNNVGRVFYMAVPLVLYFLAEEAAIFYKEEQSS